MTREEGERERGAAQREAVEIRARLGENPAVGTLQLLVERAQRLRSATAHWPGLSDETAEIYFTAAARLKRAEAVDAARPAPTSAPRPPGLSEEEVKSLITGVLEGISESLKPIFRGYKEKISALEARIAELEGRVSDAAPVAELAAKVGQLEAKVADLKAERAVYKGTFNSAVRFNRGDLASHAGSLWHCNHDGVIGVRPGADHQWTLVSKSGQPPMRGLQGQVTHTNGHANGHAPDA